MSQKYNWNYLISVIDIIVRNGNLTESQLEQIIDLADIKTVVKNNKLSDDFIEKIIIPRIDNDDYDGMDLYKIKSYQSYLNQFLLNK